MGGPGLPEAAVQAQAADAVQQALERLARRPIPPEGAPAAREPPPRKSASRFTNPELSRILVSYFRGLNFVSQLNYLSPSDVS